MKIIVNKLLVLIAFLSGVVDVVAKATPPMPTGKKPPPPPGLPIDQGVFIAFVIAVLFGIYVIYNHRLNKKTPV